MQQTFTLAYDHRSNRVVERCNRTMLHVVRKLCTESPHCMLILSDHMWNMKANAEASKGLMPVEVYSLILMVIVCWFICCGLGCKQKNLGHIYMLQVYDRKRM